MPREITSFVASPNTSLLAASYPEDANLIMSSRWAECSARRAEKSRFDNSCCSSGSSSGNPEHCLWACCSEEAKALVAHETIPAARRPREKDSACRLMVSVSSPKVFDASKGSVTSVRQSIRGARSQLRPRHASSFPIASPISRECDIDPVAARLKGLGNCVACVPLDKGLTCR